MYKRVGIVGLGLIGGSLAKALKNRLGVQEIVACNRNEDVLSLAYREGVIDEYTTEINDKFRNCEIIFLCTPVNTLFHFAKEFIPYIDPNCIITDVGSTKGRLFEDMRTLKEHCHYIGGHPMTGSEKFRYQASKEHLFECAYYIIAPGEDVPQAEIDTFTQMVQGIGAIPVTVAPDKHDTIVAAISHVPHVLAAGLVNMVKKMDSSEGYMHLLAAGGFKDMTRIASSNPEMWESICIDNRFEILKTLDIFEEILKDIKAALSQTEGQKIMEYFAQARQYRNSFPASATGSIPGRHKIHVDVLDKPGSIAIISVLLSSNGINIKDMGIVSNREQDAGALSIVLGSQQEMERSIQLLESYNYEVFKKD